MNSCERMKAMLNHEEADRVPVYPILSGAGRLLIGADYPTWSTNAEVCAESFLKSVEEFDIDCVVSLIDLSVECDAWGQQIIYPQNEAAHPDYKHPVITDIEDYETLPKADYTKSKRMMMAIDVAKKLVKELKGKKPVIAFVFGPMGTLSMLRGQEQMYMDLYDDPDAVQDAVWKVAETLKDYVSALCDTGVDGIMFDTLFSSGSIMRKEMWTEMEAKPLGMLCDTVREHGCMTFLHNCGQRVYFDAQIEAAHPDGISFLYPPDDCKDYAECKEKYGDKVTLIGAVSPSSVVVGTDEEWDQQCKEQIDAMAKGGGFLLATGCEYPANASFDRAKRMIEIAKTYGVYHK